MNQPFVFSITLLKSFLNFEGFRICNYYARHVQIEPIYIGQLLYSEDHLYRVRRTHDQGLNPEDHGALF
jgi:hypothetical protein